ncbi:opaque [Micractinium conductrix]|uniref:Opaque n=1 Tax=Micractinium conductrix TaxID=554055 RepID=A0A2P6V5M0_9CHLO|nr:opaque [Micractinium conductrix]|eukprot:PSC69383.1 opaque [Micractinium conductrix]
MDLLLSPLTAAPLSPPRPGHRRCASAPSLDGMAEAALQIETTPCSVLDLEAVDDDVSRSLRRTLQVVQAELTEAVAAGVLRLASNEGDDDDPAGPPGRLHHTAYSAEGGSDGEGPSGSSERELGGGGGGQQGQGQGLAEMEHDVELAGLSAREREAALRRAKNREAARRSRERKMERISGLQAEVARLRANNFVLAKCVEEVATKALRARAEQRQLRAQLAQAQPRQPAGLPAGEPLLAGARHQPSFAALPPPAAGACTPPAAQRAAALERQLLALEEAGPLSPTQLLLPRWPAQAGGSGGGSGGTASVPPRPTSAELRRELLAAVAGEGGLLAPAADHHLHPSPVAPARQPWHEPPSIAAAAAAAVVLPQPVLQLQREGSGGLNRTCSAPSALLAGAAAAPADGSGLPEGAGWLGSGIAA